MQCKQCRHVSDLGVCVPECPVGKYADGNGECQPCNSQCAQALGCNGPAASQCVACANVYDVSSPSVAYTCLAECPSKHYEAVQDLSVPDSGNATAMRVIAGAAVCTPCSSRCAFACDGPAATDCVGGCAGADYEGLCVDVCPSHTYLDNASCRRCHPNCNHTRGCSGPGRDQCIECRDDGVSLGQECLSACPSGYFADEDRVCRECHATCTTCFGPTARECFRCQSHRINETCVEGCDLQTMFAIAVQGQDTTTNAPLVTDFVSSGSDGSADTRPPRPSGVAPASPYECVRCHEECGFNGCSSATAYDCNECANVQLDGKCVSACPTDMYREDRVCTPCHPQCAGGCFSSGADSCFACRAFEVNGFCVDECPEHYVQVDGACLPCHRFCSEDEPGCTGVGPDACTACAPTRFLIESTHTCVAACPTNTYPAEDNTCMDCSDQCSGGCFGPFATQCTECANVKLGTTCVDECPTGFFVDGNGVCQRCNALCKSRSPGFVLLF